MTEALLTALITGGLSLIGVVITCNTSNRKTTSEVTHKLELHQAITDTKLEELTREVRAHNNFAERIPVIAEQIKVVNHRIDDLEQFHKPGAKE